MSLYSKEGDMSLKNLNDWNTGVSKKVSSGCGTKKVSSGCGTKASACGAKKKPSACGTK